MSRGDGDVVYDVAPLSDLPDPGLLGVSLPSGERVCLIRRGGRVTALRDECTHQGMPLSAGELHDDGTVECPWHGARFDGATGEPRRGPAEVPVATFDVRVEGDRVLVVPPSGSRIR